MKKNKILKISLLILLLAMLTMCVISGTLAKYVETAVGIDAARVAKFEYSIEAGGEDLVTSGTMNLFNTVNDPQVAGDGVNMNNGDKLVAPGTYGSFDVVVTNKSEVDVNVVYQFEQFASIDNDGNVTDSTVPIVYFVRNGSTLTYYSKNVAKNTVVTVGNDVKTITGTDTVTVTGNLEDMGNALSTTSLNSVDKASGKEATTTIGWFWAFAGDDETDTALGKGGNAPVQFAIGVTFTQAD